jgi:hypothetical protein
LTDEEARMLERYCKNAAAVESFRLLQASALASNKLIETLEDSFAGQELTSSDYLFLQVLSDKKRRNYRKLSDVSATVKLFTMLRDLSLKAANIEGS